jgi:hypothetical protein
VIRTRRERDFGWDPRSSFIISSAFPQVSFDPVAGKSYGTLGGIFAVGA